MTTPTPPGHYRTPSAYVCAQGPETPLLQHHSYEGAGGPLATLDAEAQMNEYGLAGWEFVAVHPRGDQVVLFMKRPEPDLQHDAGPTGTPPPQGGSTEVAI
jgi:hypothetical protein